MKKTLIHIVIVLALGIVANGTWLAIIAMLHPFATYARPSMHLAHRVSQAALTDDDVTVGCNPDEDVPCFVSEEDDNDTCDDTGNGSSEAFLSDGIQCASGKFFSNRAECVHLLGEGTKASLVDKNGDGNLFLKCTPSLKTHNGS